MGLNVQRAGNPAQPLHLYISGRHHNHQHLHHHHRRDWVIIHERALLGEACRNAFPMEGHRCS